MMSPSNLLRTSALLLCLLPVGCEPDSELVDRLGKLEEDSARFKREAQASQKQAEIWKSELDKLRAEKTTPAPAPTPVATNVSSRETEQLITAVRDELRAFREEIKGMKTSMEKIERIKWPEERPASAEPAAQPTPPPSQPRPRPAVPGDVNEIRWPEEQGGGSARPAPAPSPRPTPAPRQLQPPGEGGPPGGEGAPIEIRWPEER